MVQEICPKQISLFDSLENGSITVSGKVISWHNTYKDIISFENLLYCWQEFLCGKRKRKDVAEFLLNFSDISQYLLEELDSKTYIHSGYEAFKIRDPKPRDIHKASVRDRLLHHIIYNSLYLYFDKKFIFDSYSCRLGKGTHKAINRFRKFGLKVSKNNTKTCWVLKCDIRKFFASIDHNILKNILSKSVKNKNILCIANEIISSFETKGKNNVGLPLGNLTSQLFVNIYMNKFDNFMKRELKTRFYIRYADDFVVFSKDKDYLLDIVPKISLFLDKELKLSLHPKKLTIKTLSSGIDFLGWVNFPKHRILRKSTKIRMFKNIEKKFNSEIIASYIGLISHGNTHNLSLKIKKMYYIK